MSQIPPAPFLDQFMATAAEVAEARPEVDLDIALEILAEAATLLHNGLALDGLDDHDTDAVVSGLCAALVAQDPGAAIRARAKQALDDPAHLHDPDGVSAAYLISAGILQL